MLVAGVEVRLNCLVRWVDRPAELAEQVVDQVGSREPAKHPLHTPAPLGARRRLLGSYGSEGCEVLGVDRACKQWITVVQGAREGFDPGAIAGLHVPYQGLSTTAGQQHPLRGERMLERDSGRRRGGMRESVACLQPHSRVIERMRSERETDVELSSEVRSDSQREL